jgi:4-hydroxy-2-oxoheptanedioate aldolase
MQHLQEGRMAIVPILGFYAPALVEMLGYAGFDCIMFDCEHGNLGIQDVENMIRAAHNVDVTPFARVTRNEAKDILRVMDAGAYGFMVPQVETSHAASDAVRAARYYPKGNRGMARSTPAGCWGHGDAAEYVKWVAEETFVMVQIETISGIENLVDILRVEGVDGVIIGSTDLSQSLGFPGQPGHPRVKDAMKRIVDICREHGKPVGTVAGNPEGVAELQGQGYSIAVLGVPSMFVGAAKEFTRGLRGLGLL